jgi:hypothetical protein
MITPIPSELTAASRRAHWKQARASGAPLSNDCPAQYRAGYEKGRMHTAQLMERAVLRLCAASPSHRQGSTSCQHAHAAHPSYQIAIAGGAGHVAPSTSGFRC